ncbi:hypothetical protein SADUNF_Sadunf16G0191200 [Salix dunnii]|uniref:Uncharacterized protein n=1 Tax=Salix dunnii TaxID=1413687 RepID=A0A835JAS8_9ROSI|nr:hypothetical protein SADUNF_Sadunf16G0191200 [Salix dunnii]
MVQSYMEESKDKLFRGRHRCNCFNGNGNDSSDDEFDVFGCGFGESMGIAPSGDACDFLKRRLLIENSEQKHGLQERLGRNRRIDKKLIEEVIWNE